MTLRHHCRGVEELAASIRQVGLLQPLVVRPTGDTLELVCGQRRLMACKLLRWNSVSCLIRQVSEKDAFEIALVENIQRRSIDPIEEALAFKTYVEQAGWGGVKELAFRIGKSPEYVSHRVSLLRLPQDVLEDVREGKIAVSAAYELLGMNYSSELEKVEFGRHIANSNLSSREVRKIVRGERENRFSEILDRNEPEFTRRSSSFNGRDAELESEIIQSAILVYRVSLIRLDKLIENCKEKRTRDFLFSHRIRVHNFIDECIRYQKGLNNNSPKREA
jgi:ParB family transcriptional regulator, chromosome partitioning protein